MKKKHSLSDTMGYQERVAKKKEELDNKIARLLNFIKSKTFSVLIDEEQDRLRRQLIVMALYSSILAERIRA